jgi:hypothetical protein
MTILGDPFLTTDYDCTLYEPDMESSSHPDEFSWYATNQVQMNWSIPPDVNGVNFYYIFDQVAMTIPTTGTGTFVSTNGTQVTTMSDGTWYFHLLTVDGAGNEKVVHYTVNVDSTKPTNTLLNPVGSTHQMRAGNLNLSWASSDAESGYDHAIVRVNSTIETTSTTPITSYVINLIEGTHNVSVEAFNGAGLSQTAFVMVTVTAGISPFIYIGIGGAAVVALVVIIVVVRGRKKG